MKNPEKIIQYLNPNEKKILKFLNEKSISEICKKTCLDKTSVLRALEFLQNKKILVLEHKKEKIVDLGVNGILYKRKGLPERRLLNLLEEKRILSLEEAQKNSKLSKDEFRAALGALKKKAMIELKNKKIVLNANRQEIAKKMFEESFIEILPAKYDSLEAEKLHAFKLLEKRKNIIQVKDETTINFSLTELGKKIISQPIKDEELIEQITPEIIKNYKGKKFRKYDVASKVPEIFGGKKHFVNQAIEYARKIWTEMGFEEMSGDLIQSSFWNFDALFTAQDHPVREMQDTFFLEQKKELPDKKLVKKVRQTHEIGTKSSKGWGYNWDEEEAKKLVLRTHTTCLSARKLYEISKSKNKQGKFFALGKCFRNETVDWSHGFEFYQTEGIVVDKNANFKHLLGYLREFYKKMGFEKIRFTPAYFPYTEPSVEVNVWHPEKKCWLELGGAGIFRPEITIPLLSEPIPVLAWGQGFDRIIMDYYKIKDLRELYKNNLAQLRKIKFWMK